MSGAPPSRPPVLLIHGLWVNGRSWEGWIERYAGAGFDVHAPSWPGLDGEPADLRRDPSTIGGVGVGEVADFYESVVGDLGRLPIVMGHSYGGTITQLLVSRGRALAGVAIHSAPVKGVLRLPMNTIRATSPALTHLGAWRGALRLSKKQWHWRFCSTLSREESDALYERYCVPAPGRPLLQAAMANLLPNPTTKVDLQRADRAPLLFITSDEADHVIPGALNRENARRYKAGVTDVKEFAGRPHLTGSTPGWEAVADYALDWAVRQTSSQPTA
jgi:pimeloyl-ACP methyl ester carboxylesterase